MGWNASGAWSASAGHNGVAPILLRLLPRLHHPPARLFLPGSGAPGEGAEEVAALHARGYDVVAADPRDPARREALRGPFDLICEIGLLTSLSPADRPAYVQGAAALLRPGGQLFGAAPDGAHAGEGSPAGGGITSAALLGMLSPGEGPGFEVAHLAPSAFTGPDGRALLEFILVRR